VRTCENKSFARPTNEVSDDIVVAEKAKFLRKLRELLVRNSVIVDESEWDVWVKIRTEGNFAGHKDRYYFFTRGNTTRRFRSLKEIKCFFDSQEDQAEMAAAAEAAKAAAKAKPDAEDEEESGDEESGDEEDDDEDDEEDDEEDEEESVGDDEVKDDLQEDQDHPECTDRAMSDSEAETEYMPTPTEKGEQPPETDLYSCSTNEEDDDEEEPDEVLEKFNLKKRKIEATRAAIDIKEEQLSSKYRAYCDAHARICSSGGILIISISGNSASSRTWQTR
jgi:hypothetical protein